jgi:hypothetical protein
MFWWHWIVIRPGEMEEEGMNGNKLWQQILGLALVSLLLSGCAGFGTGPNTGTDEPSSTPYPSAVDWETAVEILNTGEVEMVTQLHSLDVTLTMRDGSEIHTVEPTIDAIFQEVEACGQPCSQIILATE